MKNNRNEEKISMKDFIGFISFSLAFGFTIFGFCYCAAKFAMAF